MRFYVRHRLNKDLSEQEEKTYEKRNEAGRSRFIEPHWLPVILSQASFKEIPESKRSLSITSREITFIIGTISYMVKYVTYSRLTKVIC